eukprot:1149328-Rhodomonas_salina.2
MHSAITGAYNTETMQCTIFVTQSQTLLLTSVIDAITNNTFYDGIVAELTVAPVRKSLSHRAVAFLETQKQADGGVDLVHCITTAGTDEADTNMEEETQFAIDLACHETMPVM